VTAVTRYCRCGASMRGSVTPPAAARRVVALFDEFHTGEGHGPATAAQAAAARRREERQLINEMKES
jgi:hypothetical protein